MTLLRIIAWAVILIAVQTTVVVAMFMISTSAGNESPLVMILFAYLPTISFVEKTGNFVGCANMVEPLLIGVPIGIVVYSVIGSFILFGIKRLRATR